MKNKLIILLVLLCCIIIAEQKINILFAKENNVTTSLQSDSCCCIKDSINAIQHAKKEFVRVYGEEILKQEPFVGELVDSIWYVYGTNDKLELKVVDSVMVKGKKKPVHGYDGAV